MKKPRRYYMKNDKAGVIIGFLRQSDLDRYKYLHGRCTVRVYSSDLCYWQHMGFTIRDAVKEDLE